MRLQSDPVHDLIDDVKEEEDMEPLPKSLLNIGYDGKVSNDNLLLIMLRLFHIRLMLTIAYS